MNRIILNSLLQKLRVGARVPDKLNIRGVNLSFASTSAGANRSYYGSIAIQALEDKLNISKG